MDGLKLLLPEFGLSLMALGLMVCDLFFDRRAGKALLALGFVAAGVALGSLGLAYNAPEAYSGLGTLWAVDPMSLFFKAVILATTTFVLMLSIDYKPAAELRHPGSFTALVLFSAVGMMLLVSATDLLLIFLSLELVSICSFILVGFERRDLKSSEGAIKYFLFGSFSSAIFIYGISFLYGALGSTSLLDLRPLLGEGPALMFMVGCILLLVGFGFKVSMVPFHFWVPDAYEGAPIPVTTFLSIAPKAAALGVMVRVFNHLIPHSQLELTGLFSLLAVLTMTVGNLTALFQTNIKRLLAYSSIAQAGYMLIGFVTADAMGREGLILYTFVYVFMNLGAFAVALTLGNEEGYELEAFDGLSQRNLGLALLMTFFMLSLAGIPPLAGFIAKFTLFAAAVKTGHVWLAVAAVLNSVISVYYYMSVVYHMFFKQARTHEPAPTRLFVTGTLAVAAVGVLFIGLYPEPFLAVAHLSAEFLPSAAALP
ncbi:MAG: NADH-quinone oxidoreductase subunit N [Elusimicrobia bacterium]|nr:NADH-quinone oxidoreductase subunit N [Elusimicrobiota bacterium]